VRERLAQGTWECKGGGRGAGALATKSELYLDICAGADRVSSSSPKCQKHSFHMLSYARKNTHRLIQVYVRNTAIVAYNKKINSRGHSSRYYVTYSFSTISPVISLYCDWHRLNCSLWSPRNPYACCVEPVYFPGF